MQDGKYEALRSAIRQYARRTLKSLAAYVKQMNDEIDTLEQSKKDDLGNE